MGLFGEWYKSYTLKRKKRKMELIRRWDEIARDCTKANQELEGFMDQSRYISRQLLLGWETSTSSLKDIIKKTRKYKKLSPSNKQAINRFLVNCSNLSQHCIENNRKFIAKEKQRYQSLFDNIEGRALDDQQRECIVKDEINNLVIAGAGSGKTTTIVGKVKYLLDRYSYQPSELLVLSFTSASAKEMAERIHRETGQKIDTMTFHKLGKEIIAQVEDKQPTITGIELSRFIEEQFDALSKEPRYRDILITYFLSYYKNFQSPLEFKTQGEYLDYLQDNQIVTFNGEKVKSYEEMEIANFLYINKIDYAYEQPYKQDVATRKHSQYKPDFYLPDYDIYLEHFGIDRNGNVPSFFSSSDGISAKEAYNNSILWKRDLHKHNDTVMIETYSYEMSEGVLIQNLKAKLQTYGVKHQPMSRDELWDTLNENTPLNLNSFATLIDTFINHLKANNYSIEAIKAVNNQRYTGYHQRRNNCFISLVEPIYLSYNTKLKEKNEIDFNDMINLATHYILHDSIKTDYKYIIVDEYQDMSVPRYRLIAAIKERNTAKLFCVGDDWQSIYRFAGSDINFFANFEKYFGFTEKSYIETTYRSPTDIIALSSNFILKNPNQIIKNLKSVNTSSDSAFEIIYGSPSSLIQGLKAGLDKLPNKSSVLLLGRYNADIENYLDKQLSRKYDHHRKVTNITYSDRKDLDIRFMTAHGSKGLQADYVYILNNQKGRLGFPSNIADDPVLNLVLQKEEKFPYAEERRLFYVALTRAKKYVCLLVNRNNKSAFVRELEKDYDTQDRGKNSSEPCPQCKTGHLVRKQGSYGAFYGCSHYPRCKYTRNIYNKQARKRKTQY